MARKDDRLLIDPCTSGTGQSMDIAAPDGGKTHSLITSFFTFHGSIFCLDPKGKISAMIGDSLEMLGRRVIILDPHNPAVGFNATDWIDINRPMAEQHVRTIISWAFPDDRKSGGGDKTARHFENAGKQLCLALLAHQLWTPGAPKTLREMRNSILAPPTEIREHLERIHSTSNSPMARMEAGKLLGEGFADETFSSVTFTAATAIDWLGVDAMAKMVSGNTFKTSDIIDKPTVLFVQIPSLTLQTSPGIGRVVLGSMVNAMFEAGGTGAQRKVFFALDEVASLGQMDILKTGRNQGREYGIIMQFLYQTVWDIADQWGRDGLDAWLSGMDWRRYSNVRDHHTAELLSKEMGKFPAVTRSDGRSQGQGGQRGGNSNRNVSWHETPRDLMTPDEIMNSLKRFECIIRHPGNYQFKAKRPLWWDIPEIAAFVTPSRFDAA